MGKFSVSALRTSNAKDCGRSRRVLTLGQVVRGADAQNHNEINPISDVTVLTIF
jgi:hypothetical protein